ncbi:hypothetical protein FQZ97_857310 [compost metagenome]
MLGFGAYDHLSFFHKKVTDIDRFCNETAGVASQVQYNIFKPAIGLYFKGIQGITHFTATVWGKLGEQHITYLLIFIYETIIWDRGNRNFLTCYLFGKLLFRYRILQYHNKFSTGCTLKQ